MECIYLKEYSQSTNELAITDISTISHIKALRLRQSEDVMITNGQGISAIGNFITYHKLVTFISKQILPSNYNENNNNLSVLISLLDNKERLEFAIEKAVELGISNIFIAQTQYASKRKYKIERLESKIIAAMQQSMRTVLPQLHYLENIFDIFNKKYYFSEVYVADISGNNISIIKPKKNSIIIVGPEGGLSEKELNKFRSFNNTIFVKLGSNRLRAETAVISSISIINNQLDN